jgi:ferredoxin-type protein NapH
LKIGTMRRTSQVIFLALTIIGIAGVTTTGLIYPYFFCYACPWDVGNCPLGILEHGFIDIQITFWIGLAMLVYLVGFMSLMGLLLGRAYCGWACPMGLLQDITRKFKISDKVRNRLKPNVNPKYKNVKYLILLAIPITAYLSKDLFYTNLCPVGGVTGTIPTLLFYSSEWVLGSAFSIKATSIILFLALIILVARGWCKYLCPIGAILAPFNRFSRVGVKRDEKKCTDCNLCEMKCPMDVKDIGKKPDSECVLCGRCVASCKSKSLKLGYVPFSSKKFMAVWLVLLVASSAMLAGGAMFDGYSRADKINSLPCLGCLALDPYKASEWRVTTEVQPSFVTEALAARPVFLHYRTDVCPGCDEMEPHITILEEQYGSQVKFVHINLDHANAEQDASYDIYDFAGTPENRFGVPMFSTVITVMNGTQPETIYNTQYGSSVDQGESKRLELEQTILNALGRHVPSAGPVKPSSVMVLTELFVDQGCVNCYKGEDALVELGEANKTNFVTFVTDAPAVSGQYSIYRETAYNTELSLPVPGHPWAVFAGGPGEVYGALSTGGAKADYQTEINSASLADVELSIAGSMQSSSGALNASIFISNLENTDQTITVEGFLVERISRWPNLQGDPIPNAFVDLLVNGTYMIPAGGDESIPISWAGTSAVQFTDLRMGNIAIVLVAWQNGVQITSKVIASSEPDALFMTPDAGLKAALPDSTANFTFTIYNYLDASASVNLSVEEPVNWSVELSVPAITIPANGNATFSLLVTGNGTSSTDPAAEFKVQARGTLDPTLQASSKVQVEVKDDITPPIVLTPVDSPDLPRADEAITVTVVVGDNTQVDSVQLSYFSCTPEACSPYYIVDMNLTSGNRYNASVYPAALDHTSFHYRIIATDTYGNTQNTQLYDIVLEPHHTARAETTKPKWIGVVLLLAFAAIGIAIALSSRQKPVPPKKQAPGDSSDIENDKPNNRIV